MPLPFRTLAAGVLPQAVHTAVLDALALVMPVECAGCGRADRSLCSECRGILAGSPVRRELPWGTLHTSLEYDGVVRAVILDFKENGRPDVAAALAVPLGAAIRAACAAVPGRAELLRVPPSVAGLRRRGFDPVSRVLRHARLRGSAGLRMARSGAAQKTLGIGEREANRSGSMSSRRSLEGRSFILVDDIVTTGATLADAARAVRAGGGEVVGAAAIAFTRRRRESSASIAERSLRGGGELGAEGV